MQKTSHSGLVYILLRWLPQVCCHLFQFKQEEKEWLIAASHANCQVLAALMDKFYLITKKKKFYHGEIQIRIRLIQLIVLHWIKMVLQEDTCVTFDN